MKVLFPLKQEREANDCKCLHSSDRGRMSVSVAIFTICLVLLCGGGGGGCNGYTMNNIALSTCQYVIVSQGGLKDNRCTSNSIKEYYFIQNSTNY